MPTEISIATRNSKWTPLSPAYIMHIRWIRSARLEPVGEWEQIKKWVYWSSFWKPIYKGLQPQTSIEKSQTVTNKRPSTPNK